MSSSLRRYLLVEHVVGAGVFNFLLNGLIAWLAFRSLDVVPLWGEKSIAGDTIGTTIVLPVLTSLVATRIVRWHLRSGRVVAPGPAFGAFGALRMLPDGLFGRGLTLATASMVLAAPLAIGAIAAAGVDHLSLGVFLVFKAAYAAGLAAIVQPLLAVRGLMENPGDSGSADGSRKTERLVA